MSRKLYKTAKLNPFWAILIRKVKNHEGWEGWAWAAVHSGICTALGEKRRGCPAVGILSLAKHPEPRGQTRWSFKSLPTWAIIWISDFPQGMMRSTGTHLVPSAWPGSAGASEQLDLARCCQHSRKARRKGEGSHPSRGRILWTQRCCSKSGGTGLSLLTPTACVLH